MAATISLTTLAALAACADWARPPTFPESAAHQTMLEEQALLGFDARGDALAAQLIAAEGNRPKLSLLVFDRDGAPTRTLLEAGDEVAAAVSQRVLLAGERAEPLLGAAVDALWPDAALSEKDAGFSPAPPTPPEPAARRWMIVGATGLPLSLRVASQTGPSAALLLLSETPLRAMDTDESEIAQMPLAGVEVAPLLWIAGANAWLLSGSVLAVRGEPLHRSVGLLRGSLGRGESMLHNQHGLADYGAGELDAARREFDRALIADPRYVDALYNAAAVAALEDRSDEAVALLRRAAEEDPRRVQVLGRDDEDLRTLRQRPDVREILGLVRLPP